MPDNEMKPVLSPSVELWGPDGPAVGAAAAIMANAVASFNEALVPVLRGTRRGRSARGSTRNGGAPGFARSRGPAATWRRSSAR